MLKTTRPRLDVIDAKKILRDTYDVDAHELAELPSERDQNFLVTTPRERLVLKIASASETREILEFQNQAPPGSRRGWDKRTPRMDDAGRGTLMRMAAFEHVRRLPREAEQAVKAVA